MLSAALFILFTLGSTGSTQSVREAFAGVAMVLVAGLAAGLAVAGGNNQTARHLVKEFPIPSRAALLVGVCGMLAMVEFSQARIVQSMFLAVIFFAQVTYLSIVSRDTIERGFLASSVFLIMWVTSIFTLAWTYHRTPASMGASDLLALVGAALMLVTVDYLRLCAHRAKEVLVADKVAGGLGERAIAHESAGGNDFYRMHDAYSEGGYEGFLQRRNDYLKWYMRPFLVLLALCSLLVPMLSIAWQKLDATLFALAPYACLAILFINALNQGLALEIGASTGTAGEIEVQEPVRNAFKARRLLGWALPSILLFFAVLSSAEFEEVVGGNWTTEVALVVENLGSSLYPLYVLFAGFVLWFVQHVLEAIIQKRDVAISMSQERMYAIYGTARYLVLLTALATPMLVSGILIRWQGEGDRAALLWGLALGISGVTYVSAGSLYTYSRYLKWALVTRYEHGHPPGWLGLNRLAAKLGERVLYAMRYQAYELILAEAASKHRFFRHGLANEASERCGDQKSVTFWRGVLLNLAMQSGAHTSRTGWAITSAVIARSPDAALDLVPTLQGFGEALPSANHVLRGMLRDDRLGPVFEAIAMEVARLSWGAGGELLCEVCESWLSKEESPTPTDTLAILSGLDRLVDAGVIQSERAASVCYSCVTADQHADLVKAVVSWCRGQRAFNWIDTVNERFAHFHTTQPSEEWSAAFANE